VRVHEVNPVRAAVELVDIADVIIIFIIVLFIPLHFDIGEVLGLS